jgi:hypothetical protein
MKPDHLRRLALIEMATHSVAGLRMQIRDAVGVSEDRLAKGPCGKASLGLGRSVCAVIVSSG